MTTGTARVASSARSAVEHLPAVQAGKSDVQHDRSRRQRADQLEPFVPLRARTTRTPSPSR